MRNMITSKEYSNIFVINMIAIDFKLAFNIMAYSHINAAKKWKTSKNKKHLLQRSNAVNTGSAYRPLDDGKYFRTVATQK